MTRYLFLLNDAPYGSERAYNAVRLAGALAKREGNDVEVFLMGDSASAARRGQKVPQGYYNLEVTLGAVIRRGGAVGVCGTCMDARGIDAAELMDGAHRGTLDELAERTAAAERVLVF